MVLQRYSAGAPHHPPCRRGLISSSLPNMKMVVIHIYKFPSAWREGKVAGLGFLRLPDAASISSSLPFPLSVICIFTNAGSFSVGLFVFFILICRSLWLNGFGDSESGEN